MYLDTCSLKDNDSVVQESLHKYFITHFDKHRIRRNALVLSPSGVTEPFTRTPRKALEILDRLHAHCRFQGNAVECEGSFIQEYVGASRVKPVLYGSG